MAERRSREGARYGWGAKKMEAREGEACVCGCRGCAGCGGVAMG